MPPDIYEQRVVLFLDILGFRSLIESKKEEALMEALSIPENLGLTVAKAETVRLTAFSDSIVVSDALSDGHGCLRVAWIASHLALNFMIRGIMVRGGIAAGSLHHEEGRVFGPAMNNAYALESENAIYPRIVVDDQVRDIIANSTYERKSVKIKSEAELLREDFDGVWHVDVLGRAAIRPKGFFVDKDGGPSLERSSSSIAAANKRAVDAVLESRTDHKLRIRMKYDWLERYRQDAETKLLA